MTAKPELPRAVSHWTPVVGHRIHFWNWPGDVSETPMVLVHGLGVSGRYLLRLGERLAPRRMVLVPDLPGFGKSDTPSHALSVPELAETLAAWLDTLGLTSVCLLGNSMGCQVIADFATRWPDRLTHLVLLAPTIDSSRRSSAGQLASAFCDIWVEPWSLWAIVVRDYLRVGPTRLWKTLQAALESPIESLAPSIAAPTLLVRGGRDRIVLQPWVEELVRMIPQAKLLTIPNGTHAINFSAPADVATAVEALLQAGMLGPMD
jgi:2-hydroxy-6-oxonona-2,4-dienedioate hydrolase